MNSDLKASVKWKFPVTKFRKVSVLLYSNPTHNHFSCTIQSQGEREAEEHWVLFSLEEQLHSTDSPSGKTSGQ